MPTGVAIHEQQLDERSDRAVRWVLWVSLAVAVAPMVVAIGMVGPTLVRLSQSDAAAGLESELNVGRGGTKEHLRSILARGASGIVRAVGGEPAPEFGALDVRPFDPTAARNPFADVHGPTRSCTAGGDGAACAEAVGALRPDAEMRLWLAEPPDPAPAAPASFIIEREPSTDRLESGWRVMDEGVFVRTMGDASFVLEGALSVDDFDSLRPISEVGVGGYLSDVPELHHSAFTGSAARTFSQGRWTVRPELDLGANYLALDKVRLDAGEAGLFLPEADDWVFSARPSVAFEGQLDPVPGIKLLPRFRAGATWLSQTDFQNAALMLDAPTSIAGLAALTPLEETFADIEAGIGVAAAERIQLSVRYGRLFGESLEADTGRVELSMQF